MSKTKMISLSCLGLTFIMIFIFWETPINQIWYYIIIPFSIGLLISLMKDFIEIFKLIKSKKSLR